MDSEKQALNKQLRLSNDAGLITKNELKEVEYDKYVLNLQLEKNSTTISELKALNMEMENENTDLKE